VLRWCNKREQSPGFPRVFSWMRYILADFINARVLPCLTT
jgi:hypothetical protein